MPAFAGMTMRPQGQLGQPHASRGPGAVTPAKVGVPTAAALTSGGRGWTGMPASVCMTRRSQEKLSRPHAAQRESRPGNPAQDTEKVDSGARPPSPGESGGPATAAVALPKQLSRLARGARFRGHDKAFSRKAGPASSERRSDIRPENPAQDPDYVDFAAPGRPQAAMASPSSPAPPSGTGRR